MKEIDNCVDPKIGVLLYAYELNALPEDQAEHFEIHLMKCGHCLSAIENMSPFIELLRHDEETRGEINRVLAEEFPPETFLSKARRNLWPRRPLLFRPAILYFVIAITVIAAFSGIFPGRDQEPGSVQSLTLIPSRSQETEAFSRSAKSDGIIIAGFREAVPETKYRVVIKSKHDSAEIADIRSVEFDSNGFTRLLFPAVLMKPGIYRLEIMEDEPAASEVLQEYYFTVTR